MAGMDAFIKITDGAPLIEFVPAPISPAVQDYLAHMERELMDAVMNHGVPERHFRDLKQTINYTTALAIIGR